MKIGKVNPIFLQTLVTTQTYNGFFVQLLDLRLFASLPFHVSYEFVLQSLDLLLLLG
jgi:hypothetical protein